MALVLALACSDSTSSDGGGTKPPSQLNFLTLAPTAPDLCETSISFWAFRGVGVDTALQFPEPGDDCLGSREDFLRLKLDQASLKAYPDGTPIQFGDSVLITMSWVGNDSILFHLEPTGLLFDPAHPAELKIDYGEAGDDLDGDGDIDADDDSVERRLDIWRQPTLADDYQKVGIAKFEDLDEIEADLNGFSRYAIAY
ncbi:MAG: hypothetical protein OEV95_00790 [Gemmatimonadota bacterium]|nr:hypothetical protein [Gemmatimonadota bacterium]